MRRRLTTIALVTSSLGPTDAAELNTRTGDEGSTQLSWHVSNPDSALQDSEGRAWTRRIPPELKQVTSDERFYPWFGGRRKKDDDKKDDDKKDDNEKDDDNNGDEGEDNQTHSDWSTTTWPTSTSTSIPSEKTVTVSVIVSTQTRVKSSSTNGYINPSATFSSASLSLSPSPSPSPEGTTSVKNGESPGKMKGDKDNKPDGAKIAAGVVGGLLLLLLLLFAWYFFVIRPKRRERLRGERLIPLKDSDIESRITLAAVRSGPDTPRGGPSGAESGSTGLSSHPIHVLPLAAASTAAHATGPGGQVESVDRGPSTSPPPGPFPGYAEPHPGFNAGSIPPDSPTQGLYRQPLSLQTDASSIHSNSAPTAMELDGRPPPPGYPDVIAASKAAGSSLTATLPVSPLSPHASPHVLDPFIPGEPPQHRPYQGPRQPSYGDYEASALPEVVSPICQLGQTSASPPEYDESAEAAAWSGRHGHLYQHHDQRNNQDPDPGDDKQALSSQQPMHRY
ncbi:hypothetical protein F5Y14DRAFT_170471 [Nemania sp. NC0429]|nr:hypothetical protein F5Y14DRAFT_170471 [Nemania sp. NC0429]